MRSVQKKSMELMHLGAPYSGVGLAESVGVTGTELQSTQLRFRYASQGLMDLSRGQYSRTFRLRRPLSSAVLQIKPTING